MPSYFVVQPIMDGLDRWESATIISRHRTRAAASEARDKANRKLRRQPGMAQSWVDWHIIPSSYVSADKRKRKRK